MKLEEFVSPICISLLDDSSILIRDVLSNLLYLINVAEAENRGKWAINDIYRTVAGDLLALSDVSCPSDIKRHSLNIIE